MDELRAEIWEALLSGRTAADALALAKRCRDEPEGVSVLAEAAAEAPSTTRGFAMAAIKKLAEIDPSAAFPARSVLLDPSRPDDFWVTPILASQAAALVPWPREEWESVRQAFEPHLASPNRFVRSCALRALAPVAEAGSDLEAIVLEACDRFLAEGGAPAASARNVLKSIGRAARPNCFRRTH